VCRVEAGLFEEPSALGSHARGHLEHPRAGCLAPLRRPGGRARIDDHEPGNALRHVEREPQRQRATQRVPAKQHLVIAKVIEEVDEPPDRLFRRVGSRGDRRIGGAVAEQFGRDHREVLAQTVQIGFERCGTGREPVQEDKGGRILGMRIDLVANALAGCAQ
jgi:hypothetical protein